MLDVGLEPLTTNGSPTPALADVIKELRKELVDFMPQIEPTFSRHFMRASKLRLDSHKNNGACCIIGEIEVEQKKAKTTTYRSIDAEWEA